MAVEAHAEEERACSVDLDGEHAGGVDLDSGGIGVEAVDAASSQTRRKSGR
jgi:hypothetical protein